MAEFIRNKYYRWYYLIIGNARKRKLDKFFEKHHIIPKCIKGTNDWWNIVNLTYKEHFLVHWLLIKMTEGKDRYMMLHALGSMIKPVGFRNKKIIAGWQYEISRKAFSEMRKGRKVSNETKQRISVGVKASWTEERRQTFSEYRKGLFFSENAKKKISLAHKGRKHTLEARQNMSKGAKGKKLSEETKAKIKSYKHTDEARLKMSIAAKKNKGVKWTEERKKAKSAALVGRKLTETCKENMKIAQQARRAREQELRFVERKSLWI